MKPIKLVMSAFGPYSNLETIDFEKFNNGLFLITGATGGGKTTIFDAIVFALYGEASGGKERRDSKSFRSDYANNETLTFVEFTFSHKGKTYYIKRSPKYTIQKENKEVEKNSSVYLECVDTKESFDKTDEVKKQIANIIGLDINQFTQTMMIAQGDFLKILNAKSDERKKLFQKLFHTDEYSKLEEVLREYHSEVNKKYNDNQLNIYNSLKRIVINDSFSKKDELINFINSSTSYDKNLPLLKEMNELDERALEEKKNAHASLLSMKSDLDLTIRTAEDNNNNINKYQELLKTKDILDKDKGKFDSKKVKIDLIQDANFLYPFELKYNNAMDSLDKNQKNIADFEKNIEIAKSNLDKETKELEKLNNNSCELSEKKETLGILKQGYESLVQYKKKASLITTYEQDYVLALNEVKDAKNIYNSEYQKYKLNVAGLLAKDLEDDKPCPVCGSIHHPNKATLSESHVYTIEELDELKENIASLELDEKNKQEKLNKERLEIAPLLENINKASLDVNDNLITVKENIDKLESEVKAIEDKINKLSANISSLTQTIRIYGNSLYVSNKEKENLIDEFNNCKKEFDEKLNESILDSFDMYQDVLKEKDSLDSLIKEYKEYETKAQENTTQLETLSKLIKDKTIVNTDESKKELEKVNLDISNNQKVIDEINSRFNINSKEYKELEKLIRDNKKLDYELNVAKDAYYTVSGTQSSSIKLSLEAYLQQYYFKKVIVMANKRLNVLSGGEYTLRCKEGVKDKRSQTGLDLDVYDSNTGKWRDVSTLSGGESFMASMSLALGLSDIVQSESGAVRMDSMFIDEGFGTLDDETLNQAMNVLDELSHGNRLIGIISHVNELKERIDQKIVVSKTNSGSKVSYEI